ncbi:ATP-binding protein [Paraburkholderia sediminicola]|uniref:AAA family ATPase n=1 Tax=Paraburkholderia sediminicola TaxID=458836 RepID=UPI0038BD8BB5
MRITQIEVENVLALKRVAIEVNQAIVWISGENGHGKSSLAEVLKHTLANRVTRGGEKDAEQLKKNEFINFVHWGEKLGAVRIAFDGGSATLTLPKGTRTFSMDDLSMRKMQSMQAAMPYVMDPERFAKVSADERRTYLFELTKVDTSAKAVSQRLLAKGHAEERVKMVAPLVAASFGEACDEAKAKARDAKAAWKALTGETWGSEKAPEWKAVAPAFSDDDIAAASALVEQKTAEYGEANQALGVLNEKARAYAAAADQRESLTLKAGRIDSIKAKLATDEAELANWTQKVAETQALAEGGKEKTPLVCPHCAALAELQDGKLVDFVQVSKVADAEAIENLPKYRKALETMETSVANDKRDLVNAEAAVASLAALGDMAQPSAADLEAARAVVERITGEGKAARSQLDAAQALKTAAESAEQKTADALAHHESVAAWLAIAEALSPTGIPAELMADALTPFNDRLRASAASSYWPVAQIENDMSLTVDGHPHHMQSESYQWRANAHFAEAISYFSGARLLCLDRYDLLVGQGRGDLIDWLQDIVAKGEVDTVIVMGSATAMPSGLPDAFQTEWISDGRIGVAA